MEMKCSSGKYIVSLEIYVDPQNKWSRREITFRDGITRPLWAKKRTWDWYEEFCRRCPEQQIWFKSKLLHWTQDTVTRLKRNFQRQLNTNFETLLVALNRDELKRNRGFLNQRYKD